MDPHLSLRLQQLQENLAISAKAIAETTEHLALLVPIPDQSISETSSTGAQSPKSTVTHGFSTSGELEKEKFELQQNGVPYLRTTAPKRHSLFSARSSISTLTADENPGARLLDDWSENFVLCEQEAIEAYTYLYRMRDVNPSPQRRRPSALGLQMSCSDMLPVPENLQDSLKLWRPVWDFLTIVLVVVDALVLPLLLAWPELSYSGSFWSGYYEVTPVFWMVDIVLNFSRAILSENRKAALLGYLCTWFLFDGFLVTLDLVLLLQLVPESVKALTMARLLRTAKFRHAITAVESRLAANGYIKVVNFSTILQCVTFIFGVNHTLACVTFYVGRTRQQQQDSNWLDAYNIMDRPMSFQYMISFNWVIAEYTPAPYPFTAQNELEQALMLAIILTCLPMLGAQIGIISGTLNLMNEKAKERDHVKRDLQRWLRKTRVRKSLHQRVVAALDDVLGSQESPLDVKDPLALNFLPSSLIEELQVVSTGEKLSIHPFFSMLMDERLDFRGRLASAFVMQVAVQGELIFTADRKAEGIFIAIHGGFQFIPSKNESMSLKATSRRKSTYWNNECWFAELALYTTRTHSSTLSSATYAKALTLTAQGFLQAVKEHPAIVVAAHEYASCLLRLHQKRAHFVENTWELPPLSWSLESVAGTQLAELLDPGTSHLHAFKLEEIPSHRVNLQKLMKEDLTHEEQVDEIKEHIHELREEDGVYYELNCQEDAKHATLSMLCLTWLVRGQHSSMVACQDSGRLTSASWQAIQELTQVGEMTFEELNGLMVLLGIRGICKSVDFAKLCPPSERKKPEQVLCYTVESLEHYLPSLACLAPESYLHLTAVVRMLAEFNFAQFLQGENNPHAIWLLACSLEREGERVLKMCLLAQVCILCGVTGSSTLTGSLFLNELNGRCLVKALSCLKQVQDLEPHVVYWRYITSRAEALNLFVHTASHLVLARLACLTRCVEPQGIVELQKAWLDLTGREREVLMDVFLLDGHAHKALMFAYLPLFLTNARANHDVGLLAGLKFLVEIYEKLLRHKCLMLSGPTVRVDMSSLAMVMKDVEDVPTLRKCFDFAKIVRHENGVTVLLTSASYQVLTGQLVQHTRSTDMLEQLAQQQTRLESAILAKVPRARTSVFVSECQSDMFESIHV
ncbi:unnamed protein product [Effrenium voratum]|uniref:Cyclic nucleotide-binding domain-containing protein n=1 Tax=Effrenium voratum TaxID=2562239 RepID=A0AA36N2Z2_9DINO|nr:unnamed protein product [Effrenium voratum]